MKPFLLHDGTRAARIFYTGPQRNTFAVCLYHSRTDDPATPAHTVEFDTWRPAEVYAWQMLGVPVPDYSLGLRDAWLGRRLLFALYWLPDENCYRAHVFVDGGLDPDWAPADARSVYTYMQSDGAARNAAVEIVGQCAQRFVADGKCDERAADWLRLLAGHTEERVQERIEAEKRRRERSAAAVNPVGMYWTDEPAPRKRPRRPA